MIVVDLNVKDQQLTRRKPKTGDSHEPSSLFGELNTKLIKIKGRASVGLELAA